MRLADNTIFITGGGSGIGRAFARRFQELGSTVVIGGRDSAPLRETIGGRDRMHAVALDVTDPASIAAAARQLIAEHPEVNILLNNAGVMRIEDIAAKRDLGAAETVVATNLLGPIRMTDALVEHLAARPDAAIINTSSGLGFVPNVATPTYSATKAAIHAYTIALRERLRGRAEVIELIPPGLQTELLHGQSGREGLMPLDRFIDAAFALLGRQPTPEEIVVKEVEPFRNAEAAGKMDEALAGMASYAQDDLDAHARGER